MKSALISLSLIFISCSSINKNSVVQPLTFERMSSIKLQASTEQDVVQLLGEPNARNLDQDHYTLQYKESRHGWQRASLTFSSKDNKVLGFVWIPLENEKENDLSFLKKAFNGTNFIEVPGEDSPHALSSEVSYIDVKSGITILYNTQGRFVEAIARYVPTERQPGSQIKRKKVEYTIGDALTKTNN